MSYFTDFLQEELAVILSIPYRAGLWLSHIDDVPGLERDEIKEQIALEKALKAVSAKAKDDTFINEVVDYILEHREHWVLWNNNYDTVLDDVPTAMRLIHDRLAPDAIAGYQKGVYFIASVVAQAFKEDGAMRDPSNHAKPGLFSRFTDKFKVKAELDSPENVSQAEREALQKLLHCLKG